jgi:hypothetical protein
MLHFSQHFLGLHVCQPKFWLLSLFRSSYKKDQKHALRSLPKVSALNNYFTGGRPFQHHSASSDCTNHKRRLMQQCLCFWGRDHCSHDLCCSSWWGQRCMPGMRVRRGIIISEHFLFATNKQDLFLSLWRLFEILSDLSPCQIDSAIRCTKSNVDLKSTCWFTSFFSLS